MAWVPGLFPHLWQMPQGQSPICNPEYTKHWTGIRRVESSPAAEATKARSPAPPKPRQMAPSGVSAGTPRAASNVAASPDDVSTPVVMAQRSAAAAVIPLPFSLGLADAASAEASMAWAGSWDGDRRYAVACASRGDGARGLPSRPCLASPGLEEELVSLEGARATTVRFRRLLCRKSLQVTEAPHQARTNLVKEQEEGP